MKRTIRTKKYYITPLINLKLTEYFTYLIIHLIVILVCWKLLNLKVIILYILMNFQQLFIKEPVSNVKCNQLKKWKNKNLLKRKPEFLKSMLNLLTGLALLMFLIIWSIWKHDFNNGVQCT